MTVESNSSRGTLQNVPNEAANSLLVTQGWAHASRIWQVEFLKGRETSSTGLAGQILFSVGEDTSSELRLIEANDDDPRTETSLYECRRIAANSFHTGKNIWSYVIKGEARHVCSILTGGADGAIVVQQHRLDDISNEVENTQDVNISISEPLQVSSGDSLPFDPLHSRGPVDAASQPGALVRTTCDHDVFKSYCFSRKDSMIVVTRGGFMLEARLATDHLHYRTLVWRVIAHLKELSSFSVSAGIPKLRMTFHAGSNGDIYCVSGPQMRISHLVTIESKVTALFATPIQRFPDVYDDYNLEEHAPAAVLAETYIGSNSYKVRLYLLASDNSQPTFRGEFDLSMEKGFATSAILCIKGQSNCVTLFLGSRSGHLAVIDLQASAPDMQKRTLLSPSKTAKLHTDAITSMSWMPTATLEVSLTNGFLLSTSRDSSHMVHNIDLENGKDFAVPVHQSMLPLGPNIEGHFTDPRSGSQCFYGFSSRHLVVYDETNHLDIMRVDCGGAHRLWAFQPPCDKTTSFSATLVWTQASQLLWKPGQMPIVRSIRSGGHGREIKACAICPRMLEGRDVLLATGAEDTDIRIFRYRKAMRHDMSEDLKCLRVIKRHNTGIQCLRWSTNGEYLFSSGGREEFFIWRIRQLPLIGVGVVCESVLPPLDELSDLRITSFDVEVTHDTGLDGREKGMTMLFYMTLSNSSVRIYTYATQKRQWNLKCLNVYSTCCLSTANLLDTKPSTTLPWILITGGTDGRLTFWDLSLSPSRTSEGDSTIGRRSLRVHQSMIKDVSIAKVSSPDLDVKHYLLASGGDDNSLALTLIALSGNETEVAGNRATGHTLACTTVLIPKAHAAAIAGVALFNSMTEEVDTTSSTLQYFKLVSTANDQKIKTWRVTVDQSRKGAEAIQIFKDRTVHTPVADVACLTRLPSPDPESTVELAQVGEDGIRVIVCGAGMDIVKIGS
ncbi:MAG: hypothetical protein M1828_003158 [Chrysothrix sp. TS-e1954]|nr:MAG: hypothetical protein M1828_003158 [Chrysothrix sp. TS-e1954]